MQLTVITNLFVTMPTLLSLYPLSVATSTTISDFFVVKILLSRASRQKILTQILFRAIAPLNWGANENIVVRKFLTRNVCE